MIIAAYAGVGKTWFAQNVPDAKDLASMPYQYFIQEDMKSNEEVEALKAAPYLVTNPLFPDNYIAEILKYEKIFTYVLIPPIFPVLMNLSRYYGNSYILCYPSIDCKDAYIERYRKRGNSEEFFKIFIEQWEGRITFLKKAMNGKHIELMPDEYLVDVKKSIDKIIFQESVYDDKLYDSEVSRLQNLVMSRKKEQFFLMARKRGEVTWVVLQIKYGDSLKYLAYNLSKLLYNKGIEVRVEEYLDTCDNKYIFQVTSLKEEFIKKLEMVSGLKNSSLLSNYLSYCKRSCIP